MMQEVERWKQKIEGHEINFNTHMMQTTATANCEFFQNIHCILKIIVTTPISSCCCEPSISALRRLHDLAEEPNLPKACKFVSFCNTFYWCFFSVYLWFMCFLIFCWSCIFTCIWQWKIQKSCNNIPSNCFAKCECKISKSKTAQWWFTWTTRKDLR